MKKDYQNNTTENNETSSHQPNFILWNNRISSDFSNMCQNFNNQQKTNNNDSDWLIIDNETGEIIYGNK